MSHQRPIQCEVHTRLAEPIKAQLVEASNSNEFVYNWQASESQCELRASKSSPALPQQQKLLEIAFCKLLQVYWQNSPFDDLPFAKYELRDQGADIFIGETQSFPKGIYLHKERVRTSTHTKAHGTLLAEYANMDGQWLPTLLQQAQSNAVLKLDQFQYMVRLDGPSRPQEFWLSIGQQEQSVQAHSYVELRECH